ncbi:unnamed protein product [Peniophora sp. CBMAI 1063]|nr:unnamed protein product [Peniophora sp. CBMAI 1063]
MNLSLVFSPWMEDFIARNYHRTRGLDVSHSLPRLADRVVDALSSVPRASIERLVLQRSWTEIPGPWLEAFQVPKLKTLGIIVPFMKANHVPWSIIQLPDLTHLKLEFSDALTGAAAIEFVAAMRCLRMLAVFEMRCRQERAAPARKLAQSQFPTDTRITWNELERMSLKADSHTVFQLASLIERPPSTDLCLQTTNCIDRALLDTVAASTIKHYAASTPFDKLCIQDTNILNTPYVRHETQFWAAKRDTPYPERSGHIRGLDGLATPIDQEDPNLLSDILLSLRPESIREVRLALSPGLNLGSYSWVPCIHHLRKVTYARVSPAYSHRLGVSISTAMAILLRRVLIPDTDAGGTPPFPELSELDLSDANVLVLVGRCISPLDVHSRTMPPTFAMFLVELLQKRRALGAPLKRLYLPECSGALSRFETQNIDLLRHLPEVVWCRVPSYVAC